MQAAAAHTNVMVVGIGGQGNHMDGLYGLSLLRGLGG